MGSNGFSPDWPAGLRVLVVDRDISSTNNLVKHLTKLNYLVRSCTLAKSALAMLGQKNEEYNFEIVMTDVNMVDMADEFEFLRIVVARRLDVPVILMTADGETETVKKGILNGASGYFHKPIAAKDVCFIWKHVYRKQHSKIVGEGGSRPPSSTNKIVPMAGKGNWELGESSDSAAEKVRFIWTREHHMKFERVVAQIESANEGVTPKKILLLMEEPSLTIGQVASHLQKYRGKNKRLIKYPHQLVPTTPQVSDTDMYSQRLTSTYQNTATNEMYVQSESMHQNRAMIYESYEQPRGMHQNIPTDENLFQVPNIPIYENPFRVPNVPIDENPFRVPNENLFPVHKPTMTFEEGFNLYHKSVQQLGQPSALQNPLQTQSHPQYNVNNDHDAVRYNVELNAPQQNQNPEELNAPQQNLNLNQNSDQNPPDDSYLFYLSYFWR